MVLLHIVSLKVAVSKNLSMILSADLLHIVVLRTLLKKNKRDSILGKNIGFTIYSLSPTEMLMGRFPSAEAQPTVYFLTTEISNCREGRYWDSKTLGRS